MQNISSLIDTSGLIEKAFTQPAMRIKARSTKRPDAETATKCVLNQIETMVSEHISTEVAEKVQDAYDLYVLTNGEHADSLAQSDWESGMDDVVENTIDEYVPMLSADWMGVNTIGTALYEQDGVHIFASKLGREFYKQMTNGLSPAKILSSAGITGKEIAAALEKHNNPSDEQIATTAAAQSTGLAGVIEKIAAQVGKGYDAMTVYGDIDLVTDEDDILAGGAAPRLGLDEEDIAVLQMERLTHGEDCVDIILRAVDELLNAKPAKAKGKAVKIEPVANMTQEEMEEATDAMRGKDKSGKKVKLPSKAQAKAAARRSGDDADAAEGNLDPLVPEVLKETGATDDKMAKGLGISRSTYNNIINGKTELAPDEAQFNFLRGEVVERLNRLHDALAKLDGTEPEVVF